MSVIHNRTWESEVRQAAMTWLDDQPGEHIDFTWASKFEYAGDRIALMTQQGIRKPAGMAAALTIRTTYTPPGKERPYEDGIGGDGFQRYKYRGTDPNHHDNVALRRAMELKVPVIWFVGVAPGVYQPIYPVWIIGDNPSTHEFTLALDASQRVIEPGQVADADTRAYVERITKARLHQRVFRSKVLLAYQGKCAICRIKHAELLDAAHIIPDGQPNGQPVVPNGLSMCKIHHAAFDSKIVGVRPDLTLHVREDVLDEVDGWMLKGGIQGIHNHRLEVVPRSKYARPDPERLEERYAEFLSRSA